MPSFGQLILMLTLYTFSNFHSFIVFVSIEIDHPLILPTSFANKNPKTSFGNHTSQSSSHFQEVPLF
jgi:hypothetical protein